MERVDTFYALASADFPNGEGFLDAGAFTADYDAREILDTFFVAFANFTGDSNAVADFEIRDIGFFLFLSDFFNEWMHDFYDFEIRSGRRCLVLMIC